MVRKNIKAGFLQNIGNSTAQDRPRTDASKPAAMKAVNRTLHNLSEKAERLEDLEKLLTSGGTIVELDPDTIDVSFVKDRVVVDEDFSDFVESIRSEGQQSPVLVRPLDGQKDRYQIVYGHRRVRAIREIGGKVKAIIKELSDEEHVIAQGQENSARSNLSYIESALFAQKLSELGFENAVIMSALSCDRAALSKYQTVMKTVPEKVMSLIQEGGNIGRDRLMDFCKRIKEEEGYEAYCLEEISKPDFLSLKPNDRFAHLLKARLVRKASRKREEAIYKNGALKVNVGAKGISISFGKGGNPAFSDFLKNRLDDLYSEFEEETKNKEK